MITTDFVPGSPCMLDVGVPDVPAAASFYGAVLGWDYEPMGEEIEGGMFRKDGKMVAGLGKLTEEGARPAWMIYYTVADADATTRAVEAGGGTVRVAPTDIEQWGRMAQYSDPLGGQFAVWQPGESKGVDLVDAPGSLCWTELYTSDAAGARRRLPVSPPARSARRRSRRRTRRPSCARSGWRRSRISAWVR